VLPGDRLDLLEMLSGDLRKLRDVCGVLQGGSLDLF
jgi:hypothetical protein